VFRTGFAHVAVRNTLGKTNAEWKGPRIDNVGLCFTYWSI
jgi:hypothetical protein